jgi:hypothetical protein
MISDFQILGIEETDDIARIKSAFRKRAKELHPDLSTDENAIDRHDLFTAVCKAYRRLVAGAKSGGGRSPNAAFRAGAPRAGTGLAAYADPAYAYYKQGMKHFMRIHPSQWAVEDDETGKAKYPESDEDRGEARRKVMSLVKLFPKAYYYFSIVASEYPDSEWAFDAREKMGKIEQRIGRYRKIIESFGVASAGGNSGADEYRATYVEYEKAKKAVRKDQAKLWNRKP